MIIPFESFTKLPVHNIVPTHWVPKNDKPLGRLVADATGGVNNMNGEGVVDVCKERYGVMELPQFMEICRLLVKAKRELKNPRMSFDDINRAFSNIPNSTESVALSALDVELNDVHQTRVAVCYASMFFGASSSPYIFQVISRVLLAKITQFCRFTLIYVDDVMRVHESTVTDEDGQRTVRAICDLLSPGSDEAWKKSKASWGVEREVFLGWEFDLRNMSVCLPDKAVVKFLAALVQVIDKPKSRVKEIQRVASLMCRYGVLYPHLAPVTQVVFNETGHSDWRNKDVLREVSMFTKAVCSYWFNFMARECDYGENWSTSLYRFEPHKVEFSMQFDAALDGAGVVSPAPYIHGKGKC